MNGKLFSIATLVAFALVIGFGTFNVAKTAPYVDGERGYDLPAGDVNSFGADLSDNSPVKADRNRNVGDPRFTPDTYGLQGNLRP